MSRNYKLKDYTKKNNPSGGRRRGPWPIILLILLLAILVFVGMSIYKPVYNYITGRTAPNLPPPPVVDLEPEPTPELIPLEEPVEEKATTPQPKGALLSYQIAQDPARLKAFIDALPADINLLYLEVKTPNGEILFDTVSQQVKDWNGLVTQPVNIASLAETLKKSGLGLGVKLSVFSDPVGARGSLESAIMHTSGVLWIDNTLESGGKPWLSPYGDVGVTYNLSLISELSQKGVELIVLEHVQLPNDPTKSALLGETKGVELQERLSQFVESAQAAAGDIPVYLLLSEAQVVDGAAGRNPQNFGGDPTMLPAFGWVVQVDSPADKVEKTTLDALSNLENSLLLSTQPVASPPAQLESYIIALKDKESKEDKE